MIVEDVFERCARAGHAAVHDLINSETNPGRMAAMLSASLAFGQAIRALRPEAAPGDDDISLVLDCAQRLEGPHEWGYRDITGGTFIADPTPWTAAATLRSYADDLSRGKVRP